MRLDEYLVIEDEKIGCRKCGHVFCGKTENYKLHAAEIEREFEDVGLLRRPQSDLMDRRVVFRQYFCPGCFTNIENDTILDDVPPIHDKQLA
ncbi:MAG: acetone carboxylase subunit gamma [Actinobacteria bacterium]|nr:acetone carboxylase subunit gamma [Actinomycetota bacterium]